MSKTYLNIYQFKESLWMSCIESSGERSNIFRNRSSTLFKNELVSGEKFDSAAVSVSISSSMTNLSCTGLPVLVCCTFNELRGMFWLSDLVFIGLSDAVEARHLDTKFIIGFDFAMTLSSPASSCVLFDIALRLLMELKWLMLHTDKRWVHSPRVKFPFVNVSKSWFLVSMYLIWILESKLILSNNQSRATLWVLETCLIVGLLPFMIILVTTSLSSKMCSKASFREEFTFEEIKSTLFRSSIFPWIFFRVGDWHGSHRNRSFWCVFLWRTVTIRSHKSSAGIPSILNPASKDMISDSVELCETEVCFLDIQLISPNLQCFPQDNIVCTLMFDEYRRSNETVVCHKLWSIL